MAEDEVLVVLQALLAVEVDVEELARVEGLGDAVGVVEVRHLLVTDLGVEADDVAVVELGDEGQGVADGGQEDVAAGLVGLGLEADPEVVALVLDVLGDGVQALLVTVHGRVEVLGGVVLGALAPAPHDEGGGAQLGGQVHVAQDLAQAEAADGAVVVGQAPVLEDRVGEGVGGDHLDGQAGGLDGLLEPGDDLVALGVGGVEGEDVVVVEGDAPGPELSELLRVLPGLEGGAGPVAEGVGRQPADRPQTEREPVFLGGLTDHGHSSLSSVPRAGHPFVWWRNYGMPVR